MGSFFSILDVNCSENQLTGAVEIQNKKGMWDSHHISVIGTFAGQGSFSIFTGTIRTGPDILIQERVEIKLSDQEGCGLIL